MYYEFLDLVEGMEKADLTLSFVRGIYCAFRSSSSHLKMFSSILISFFHSKNFLMHNIYPLFRHDESINNGHYIKRIDTYTIGYYQIFFILAIADIEINQFNIGQNYVQCN